MDKKLHIKPAPGRQVRDPITAQPLAAKGEHKPASSYWLRRLRDGDVIDLTAPKKPKQAKE
ncbi:DUF2635 domain-containing protein [Alkalilimnicola sp. S0819]|uniref:DUF2635 domain-containing protein n=1 Tax=Alkalilimnicola sp. S0819 TaxID=2613922 RepID=UPI00126221C2|nr:DUF2635 domain-containing protein [Alkalilimnicola sp. S0819]KAB7624322.1 DUF2635 domain-containing protein [Alkalilimnicola sp. S0819]MPQ16147.1 DUF2635 domain-containing protein [Alkalilimnicola sp. S0819]